MYSRNYTTAACAKCAITPDPWNKATDPGSTVPSPGSSPDHGSTAPNPGNGAQFQKKEVPSLVMMVLAFSISIDIV